MSAHARLAERVPSPVAVYLQISVEPPAGEGRCPVAWRSSLTVRLGSPLVASACGHGEGSHTSHGSGLPGRASCPESLFPTWSRQKPTENKAERGPHMSLFRGLNSLFIRKGHFLNAPTTVHRANNYV